MNCSATRIANSSKSSGNSPAEAPSQRRERGDANRWQRQDTSSTGGLSSSPPLRSCSCWDSPDTARSASEPGGCSATFFILTSNCSVPAWMPFPTSRCCSTAGPSSPPGLNSCRKRTGSSRFRPPHPGSFSEKTPRCAGCSTCLELLRRRNHPARPFALERTVLHQSRQP